jgi:hypothetical protein
MGKENKQKAKKGKSNKEMIITAIIVLVIIAIVAGIGIALAKSQGQVTKLTFKDAVSIETIQKLNGKKVTITGYMSTLSPLDGKFIYLMNLPYQSCPFCVPNTTNLANTIAVYAKNGNKIGFTDKPVTVEGTIVLGDFTDEFEYKYNYKIQDAVVKEADIDQLSQNIKLYSAISQEGLVGEILNLVTQTDYNIYYEYYGVPVEELEPVDISRIDYCITKLSSISKTDYADVIENLKKLKEINEFTNPNVENKNYAENAAKRQDIDDIYNFISEWMNKYSL